MNKKVLLVSFIMSAMAYAQGAEIKLDDTVVTSTTGFETSVRKTTANPTVVTAEEIKNKNYNTVEEILEDIPAINIVRQGSNYIIDLRGQGQKAKQNVQILVDGVQMNSLDTSMAATPINTISPDTIERIEVVPGGGSVLYGSGTSGGIVNIITKKGATNKVNVGYKYGSYENKKANISLGQQIGDFDVNIAYTNQDRNGYREYDELESDAFTGNIGYKISDTQKLNFKYSKYKEEEKYPSLLKKKQLDENRKQSGMKDGEYSTTTTNKDEYSLNYSNKISSDLEFDMTGFWQKTTMDISSKSFMMSPKLPFRAEQDSRFIDKKWGFKPKFKYSYGDESNLIFGIDYIKNEASRFAKSHVVSPPNKESTSFTTNDLEKETISGFIMNSYAWNQFEFNQGFRYERANYHVGRGTTRIGANGDEPISIEKHDDNIAYELSANYMYSDSGKSYIRYEKGFTSAPPALLTNKYTENGIAYYKLNDLKAETYDNIEIGLSDYLGFTSINASMFYTITEDEITQEMAPGMPPAWIRNYNLGKTERYGLELSTAQYFEKLTLTQSWSYINAKIKDGKDGNVDISGNHVANVPENKLSFGIGYAFTPKFKVDGEIVYTGKTYIDNKNLGGKVNSYTVANLRARYGFDFGLELYGGINNLFNEKYNEQVSYKLNMYGKGYYTYDPAAERNYYVGFSYTL